ncbi:MAG: type I methionyl aminopeptidase [Rhodobacterales bacterium 12-64-8]|nr:MAG: type I methionyl aminopeptidase [Rhodobacterales bacterium 12-64-8]
MTIEREDQLDGLKRIGLIVASTLDAMRRAAEPGMTTAELDAIGAALLEQEGAKSAPKVTYNFPGATCISVFPAIAHGIPGKQVLRKGQLVNIDVSAEKDGYFADTGASFLLQGRDAKLDALCRDGRRALQIGIDAVMVGGALNAPGIAIEEFARKHRNLASHGVGGALHEQPGEIPTWRDMSERRHIGEGLVFTLEPFLSLGASWAVDGNDGWTLFADKPAPTVQYEHTLVATRRGVVITTLAA